MDTQELNFQLKLSFAGMDIENPDFERLWNRKFTQYRIYNSGLSESDKKWIMLTGQYKGKTEITIYEDSTPEQFIKDQLNGIEQYLSKDIDSVLRLKMDLWKDYLLTKLKEIEDAKIERPRRVYSFILAEAYHRGETDFWPPKEIRSKKDIIKFVENIFKKKVSGLTVYQTLGGSHKSPNEKEFIKDYHEMKGLFKNDYDIAMKLFYDYFPSLTEI
jgi:hypothetical protein